jgi:hypothetical protein
MVGPGDDGVDIVSVFRKDEGMPRWETGSISVNRAFLLA